MIKIIGADRILSRLNGYKKRINNPKPFLKHCGGILSRSAAETFNRQGRPRWATRKDTKTHPILDLTGRLRDSVELMQETSDSVYRITKKMLLFGTKVFYGWIHQISGVGKAKTRRPFLEFQEEDKQQIFTAAKGYFFHDKL